MLTAGCLLKSLAGGHASGSASPGMGIEHKKLD